MEVFGAVTALITFLSSALLVRLFVSSSGVSRFRNDCLRALYRRSAALDPRPVTFRWALREKAKEMLGGGRDNDYRWRRALAVEVERCADGTARKSFADAVSSMALQEQGPPEGQQHSLYELGEEAGARASVNILTAITAAESIGELRTQKRLLFPESCKIAYSVLPSRPFRSYMEPVIQGYVDTVGRWSAAGFILGNVLWLSPLHTRTWPDWLATTTTIGSSAGATWYFTRLIRTVFGASGHWREQGSGMKLLAVSAVLLILVLAVLSRLQIPRSFWVP